MKIRELAAFIASLDKQDREAFEVARERMQREIGDEAPLLLDDELPHVDSPDPENYLWQLAA